MPPLQLVGRSKSTYPLQLYEGAGSHLLSWSWGVQAHATPPAPEWAKLSRPLQLQKRSETFPPLLLREELAQASSSAPGGDNAHASFPSSTPPFHLWEEAISTPHPKALEELSPRFFIGSRSGP